MVYSTRRFVVCLSVCHFVLVFFGSFGVAVASLGEEGAVLFVRLLVCACLGLSVSSSSWGLGRAAVCDCGTPWTFLLPFFFQFLVVKFSIYLNRRVFVMNLSLSGLVLNILNRFCFQ